MSTISQTEAPKVFKGDKRRISEIPDTLRRHARMSKKQLHFSVIITTLLVILLVVLLVISSGKINRIQTIQENASVLQDATGAEHIDKNRSNNEITLASSDAPKIVDGKRVVLVEYGGKSIYWAIFGTEDEAAGMEAALGAERFARLTEANGKTLLVFLAKTDDEIDKCREAGGTAEFVRLERNSADAEPGAQLAEVLDGFSFIQFRKLGMARKQMSVGFRWMEGKTVEEVESESNNLQTIRLFLIALMILAAAALAYSLKSKKIMEKPERVQRLVRLIALAAAVILLAGVVIVTVQMNAKNEQKNHISEMIMVEDNPPVPISTESSGAIQFTQVEGGEKFVFLDEKQGERTVTQIQTESGLTLWTIAFYASLVLLCVIPFVLLYLFRYERDMGFSLFNTVILIVLMMITLYPVLNTVAYSFNNGTDAARGGIGIWPRKFTTETYEQILTKSDEEDRYFFLPPEGDTGMKVSDIPLYQAAWISATKTIITTLLNLLWTGMLAFALSRREYVLRKFITLIMVFTMYVNAGLIPNYLLLSQTLGLAKSYWVYIIPTMFSCFNMIIIRTYIAGLPNELVESARIDGAGDFRIYWRIIFPLCAPVLATVALFVAVGSWNSWYDTMLYNDSVTDLHSLQYYLMGKLASAGMSANQAAQTVDAANEKAVQAVTSLTMRCAITVVTALPILVIYPFLQRYFVTGMALGSVKG